MFKPVCFPVKNIQTAAQRTYPQILLPVFKYFPHIIIRQARRITVTMPVACELLTVEAVEAAKERPYPENILMIDT